jgi:hypothetical protein
MQKTISKTEEVIFAMLTENTGGSILDSGGAYGRHWERNSKKTLEDFRAEPAAWIDPEYGDATKSLFHHLTEYLTPDEGLTAAFQKFAEDYPEESWLEIIELWLDKLGVPEEGGEFYSYDRWSFNSYNFEYWLCSQTVQGTFFGLADTGYLIMQVHGGCDVRGGYTAPRVFELPPYDGKESFIFEGERAYFICQGKDCMHRLQVGPEGYELQDENGNTEDTLQDPKLAAVAPCGTSWIA